MLHIPNRTMGAMRRHGLFRTTPGDEALKAPDFKDLRTRAFARFTELDYFAEDAKELQRLSTHIKQTADAWENPHLPDKITYQITVVHKPIPLIVITRNQTIRGKKFDHHKCRFPFLAFNANEFFIGAEGRGIMLDQLMSVLLGLSETILKPIKRS